MEETTIISKLVERVARLEVRLYGIEHNCKKLNDETRNQSDQLNHLATAFSKAQSEYGTVAQNRSNPFFKSKYADLYAILKAVRPALAKHGLSFYQYTSLSDQGDTTLHSRILHASGQWLESQTKINPPKNDIQSFGSTMSYQRRYSALTILGVATSDDPTDDDGSVSTNTKISNSQLATLMKSISGKPALQKAITKKLGLGSIDNMRNSDFPMVMSIIKKTEETK